MCKAALNNFCKNCSIAFLSFSLHTLSHLLPSPPLRHCSICSPFSSTPSLWRRLHLLSSSSRLLFLPQHSSSLALPPSLSPSLHRLFVRSNKAERSAFRSILFCVRPFVRLYFAERCRRKGRRRGPVPGSEEGTEAEGTPEEDRCRRVGRVLGKGKKTKDGGVKRRGRRWKGGGKKREGSHGVRKGKESDAREKMWGKEGAMPKRKKEGY